MECLDENTLLAFVDGSLGEAERSAAERHLVSCPDCTDVVAAVAGPEPGGGALAGSQGGGERVPGGLTRGATVGRYVILDLVGRGGMGEVYAAYDPQLDRKVALKLLHEKASQGTSGRNGRERLLREAKAIARLSHVNVVVVHDAGAIDDPVHGDRVFLAMEFIEGETLAAWLAAAPRDWRAIREVFVAAGDGLAAAHAAGLVHRDFKPQNVMVGRDGTVRVMDFGLASDTSAADSGASGPDDPTGPIHPLALTRTGALLGTPLYMAPEQFLSRATDARTDQFSFCVALYEALYGERPFPSDTFAALLESVVAGRVREPPQKARVPAFVRRLLLRGLKGDPAERWPSMPALLETLRHDPARRRRTTTVVAVAVAMALAAAAGMQRLATRGQRLCRAAEDKLAGVWEPSDGARRSAVRGAFLATGRTFAPETWQRVSGLLDDYSRRWAGMYTDACEATHVRGDQSAEVLDLRMSCLEGPRGALRALTDVFSHADSAVLIQAVNAAQALPPIDRCADTSLLRAAVPPPADAATRKRVEALRTELAEVKALTDTGQWPAARAKLAPLVDAARATRYAAFLAEALAARGWLEDKSGESPTAARTSEETLWTALAARRDDIALESAALLVGIVGYGLGKYEDAERWDHLGQALLERLGPGHERAAAWLANDRAITRLRKGDYPAALVGLKSALAMKQRFLPPDHPDMALTFGSIGTVQVELGDYRAALEANDRFLDIYRRAYGADSPLLGHPLYNRGEVLELLGRHAEAERDLRDSIDRWTGQVGPDNPFIAYALTALGKTLLAEGHPRDALPTLERALRIRERAEPNPELGAETRFALARARWDADQDRPGALAQAETARDAYRKLPAQVKHAAEIDAWLAGHAAAQRRNSP